MKSQILLGVSLFGMLALSGCQTVPPDEVDLYLGSCSGTESGVHCDELGIRLRWFNSVNSHDPVLQGDDRRHTGKLMSSTMSSALSEIDFNASSAGVDLTTSSGFVVVKLTKTNGSIVSNSFAWSASNNVVSLNNPSALDSWVAQHDGQIDKVDLDFGSIQASGGDGSNTITAEARHDGQVQSGASYAWYNNGGGCGIGDCQQQ